MDYYRRAAQGGDAIAVNNVANFYDKGLSVKADPVLAAERMEKALRAGATFSRDQTRDNSGNWSLPFRKALQRRLADKKLYSGPIDGGFRPQTQAAISIFGVR
ncbi:peptidoglycan-binding protein [Pararhizobium sp. A13]|uniref:peptidoglycan-binding domain-containing protein n=1 Tax=Pararhizobium sp. A13 TaxID=3133975 RepID=UPI0032488C46